MKEKGKKEEEKRNSGQRTKPSFCTYQFCSIYFIYSGFLLTKGNSGNAVFLYAMVTPTRGDAGLTTGTSEHNSLKIPVNVFLV